MPKSIPKSFWNLALKFEEARVQASDAERKKKELSGKLMEKIRALGIKTGTSPDGVKVTLVEPESVVYNVKKFKRKLDKETFKRILKDPQIDPERLAQEVQAGNIDVKVVNACSEVVPKTGYPRVSIGEG